MRLMQMFRISGPATDSGRARATEAHQRYTPGFKEQAVDAAAHRQASSKKWRRTRTTKSNLFAADAVRLRSRRSDSSELGSEGRRSQPNSPPVPSPPALFQAFQLRKNLGQKTRIITIAR
jgi:hypothetical protein